MPAMGEKCKLQHVNDVQQHEYATDENTKCGFNTTALSYNNRYTDGPYSLQQRIINSSTLIFVSIIIHQKALSYANKHKYETLLLKILVLKQIL